MANIQVLDTKAVLQFDCIGTPTHYRIGELADLSDASWVQFTTTDLIVEKQLPEIKTYGLFLQVKNSVMESNIRSIVIDRLDTYVVINLKVIILDGGALNTNKTSIGVVLQYDGTPIQYKYALNPTLVNGVVNWSLYAWNSYSSFPNSFYIGGEDGKKDLYFLLKDSRDATDELNSNINFYNPVPPVIKGVSYLTNSASSIETIVPDYTGTANMYSCEKNGSPYVWKKFNGASFSIILDVIGDQEYVVVLKNDFGESIPYTINIKYNPALFSLDEVIINNGDINTSNENLSINITKSGTEDIAYYRLGSSSNLDSEEWIAYTSFPVSFKITKPTASVGVVVYAQIKSNEGNISDVKSGTIYYIVIATAYIKDVDGNYGLIDYGFVKLSRSSSVSGDNNCNFYDQDGNVMGRLGRIAQADMPINANSVQFQVYNDWLNRDYPGDSNCFFHHRDFYQNIIIARDYSGNKVLATGYKLYNLTPGSYTVEIWDMTIKVEAYGETAKWIINGVEYQAPQSIRYTNNGAVGIEPEYVTHSIVVDSSGIITIIGCLNGGTYPDSSNYITPGWGVIKLIKNN